MLAASPLLRWAATDLPSWPPLLQPPRRGRWRRSWRRRSRRWARCPPSCPRWRRRPAPRRWGAGGQGGGQLRGGFQAVPATYPPTSPLPLLPRCPSTPQAQNQSQLKTLAEQLAAAQAKLEREAKALEERHQREQVALEAKHQRDHEAYTERVSKVGEGEGRRASPEVPGLGPRAALLRPNSQHGPDSIWPLAGPCCTAGGGQAEDGPGGGREAGGSRGGRGAGGGWVGAGGWPGVQ